ncbi:hypothetical protein QQS21_002562 [Conoideocrella luteorostrata]|uniref:Cytochrome P450 n=1 Tax=Conoideocrella luteorostrata TaxID=1105319 RepID=A0AAJ0CUV1_9HYPO|nr:hypothetical protein QQS21_002562 [Conoideocrella luteorostrata]
MILKLQLGITIFSIAVATAIYFISLVIYRLYLSPLAKFPGPKLAAATSWYEFYHDFWRNGQYIFEIEKMHRKYGPIIRVNPEELSIHDPSFYNQLYVTESKRRTSSYETFCKGIEIEGSHLLTVDHDLHRRRRKPLESFFSRRGLSKLEHIISEVALHLESRFKELKGSGKVIRLDHACSAFSGDIIGRICLGGEPGQRFLDDSSFASDWYNVIHAVGRSIPFITGLPVTIQMLRFIPERLVLWAYPEGQMFIAFKQRATQQIQQAKMTSYDKDSTSVSLFAHIIRSDLPESEKSDQRLSNEAQVLLGAGTATAGHTITFASFYILSRPAIRRRLASELENTMAGWPNTVPTWAELEKLPFLQAIIKESLR